MPVVEPASPKFIKPISCKTKMPGLGRRLAGDRRGVIVVMFALLLPIMVGFIGLGLEVGLWFQNKRDLQTAADAGAIGGAYEKQESASTGASIEAAAMTDAARNGYDASADNLDSENPPLTGSYQADSSAVEVTITRSVNLLFSGYFLDDAVSITARAVATNSGDTDACFVSLNTEDEKAFYLSNNVDLPSGCGVYVNSSDCTDGSGGLYLDNNSVISGATQVAGCMYSNSPNAGVEGDLTEGVNSMDDPYGSKNDARRADIIANTDGVTPNADLPGETCDISATGVDVELDPGYYDSCTFSGNRTITLNPGTYYIGSSLTISGNPDIVGENVTIVMLEDSDLDFGNNGDLTLTAPSSGIYEDIAIMGHPDMDSSKQAVFHNNMNLTITGALYFPNQTIEMSNGVSVADGCTLLVSNFVYLHNNVDLQNNCDAEDDEKISTGVAISLVE